MSDTNSINKSLLPDFLVIGAGKSGTTSVDNYLKQHPDIFISKVKEPNFFGYELHSADDFAGSPQLKHYQNSVTNLRDYLALFEEATNEQVKGETSNTYLYHKRAAERILHYNPDIKLIAILRQPAERLYSRFLHLARENRLPTPEFSDCLDRSTIWWQRNDLINEGYYYQHLSRFYNLFPANRIKVYLFDDLKKDAHRLMKDIFNFLKVDSAFELDLSVEYNKSGFIKNKWYDALFGQKGVVKEGIKKIVPAKSFENLKQSQWIQKRLNNVRDKNLHRPKLDPALKHKITAEVYADDIDHLAKLIDRDLTHWKTTQQIVNQ